MRWTCKRFARRLWAPASLLAGVARASSRPRRCASARATRLSGRSPRTVQSLGSEEERVGEALRRVLATSLSQIAPRAASRSIGADIVGVLGLGNKRFWKRRLWG